MRQIHSSAIFVPHTLRFHSEYCASHQRDFFIGAIFSYFFHICSKTPYIIINLKKPLRYIEVNGKEAAVDIKNAPKNLRTQLFLNSKSVSNSQSEDFL